MQDVIIVLTVSVDCDTAALVNSGKNRMDDILVLHLEGGKDFFISSPYSLYHCMHMTSWMLCDSFLTPHHISISGNYLPSCFGASLEMLVHLHTYIREVPEDDLVDLSLTSSWDALSSSHPPSSLSSTASSSPRTSSPSNILTTPAHDIPKELFQMISYLHSHALNQVCTSCH